MTAHLNRRLSTLFVGSVAKHGEFPNANEDRFRLCDDRQVYVVSDGATESYDSALWAYVIVEAWLSAAPGRNMLGWLRKAIAQYEGLTDRSKMSWSQEAAFERGSFASLLAVQPAASDALRITAVGDSVAILIADGEIRWSFPYTNADQFRARPHLLSTIFKKNLTPYFIGAARSIRANEKDGPCHATVSIRPEKGERLLCVTDALGEWLLRDSADHAERLARILKVSSQDALTQVVEEARSAGAMRRDDTTLVILGEASHAAANA